MAGGPSVWDPRIHRITAIWNWENVVELYFIAGPKRALIDTGASYTPKEYVEPALQQLGLRLSDVDYILNTHGHLDHMGGNAAMLAESQAEVWIHEADAPLLQDLDYHMAYIWRLEREVFQRDLSAQRAHFLYTVTGPSRVHHAVRDGDVIDLGDDIQLQVVHLPGHSAGSAGFYWERKGIIFVGDALQGRGSRVGNFPLYYHPTAYRETLQRLAALPIQALALAHRYLWSGDDRAAVRTGEAARRTIQDSLHAAERIQAVMEEELRRRGGGDFLPVAQAAVHKLAGELPMAVDPRTGLPVAGAATLYATYRELSGQPTG